MANISILRKSTAFDPRLGGYRLVLEVSETEDITSKIFVNQRIKSFSSDTFEDFFVAVATPAQLEDFEKDSPGEGSSYYLTDKIDLLTRDADYLEEVFNDIISEVQKLISDIEALADLQNSGTYIITSSEIEIQP
jgi:5'-deoxynucleotidase YfbR-like HD superfamily hydrolase